MASSHHLVVIMFADIAGYTALMSDDEQHALELINRFKDELEKITPQHEGRIVQYFGDGCVVVFESASHSIDCAMELQKAFNEAPVVPVRIGMHLGDVLFKNGNVFGDGVNIASRIESLGIPGSILVSRSIRDQIKNKKDFLLVSLGKFDFKNVPEPMEVFALANPGFVVPKREQMQGKLKPRPKNKVILKWIAGLAFIVFSAIAVWFLTSQKKTAESIPEKSIAVMPFTDMSERKDQEYFSDGLSEELLNLLTQIPELKVIGRASSFSFKGKDEDQRSIAQKLGVAHLLEGSVRKDGNKIRVTAQLIRAEDGSHLWSESYDRKLEDIFKLQDDIASAVVQQLKLKLLPTIADAGSPANTEVYNLILQGNYFLEKRDMESLSRALAFYNKALAIDSLNARGWAGVAKCYNLQATWSWIDPQEGYAKSEMAAKKVIELDGKQADGYRVLGAAKMGRGDWAGAEDEIRKALKLEPGNNDALRLKALLYRSFGRYDEAIQLIKKSIELDPIRGITYLNHGLILFYANRQDEAIVAIKKVLEINPAFPRAHAFLAKIYLLQGKPQLAYKEFSEESDEDWKKFGLILSLSALGREHEAEKLLSDFVTGFRNDRAYLIAEIYAFRGEKDKAFEWLEKAYKDREPIIFIFLKDDPLLKNLEGDPRHKSLFRRMNLPLN
ncbi:MAG TPA: adenylate/guanylate cyclase domain-containing protein [Chitinophagaceae bacterium]|nr:adenylate/guanylate cyclase domain-containing protein [Chitinophagaceae bacterium]